MSESEELIEQLKKGDQSSFSAVVNKYQDLVYNTALGIVQNTADADDITQEVFVQVYLSVGSFKGDAKFSTWLYRITISKALDHEKKKKRKKRFAFVQSLIGHHEEDEIHPVEFNHPGIQLEKKESAADLFKALKQLPENQRIAFTLHKVEGQSHQEIAAIMDLSVYAVESLMGRAKANLRKLLEAYYQKQTDKKPSL